jgi:hypothetical protein
VWNLGRCESPLIDAVRFSVVRGSSAADRW